MAKISELPLVINAGGLTPTKLLLRARTEPITEPITGTARGCLKVALACFLERDHKTGAGSKGRAAWHCAVQHPPLSCGPCKKMI